MGRIVASLRRLAARAARTTFPWPGILLITLVGVGLRAAIPIHVRWASPHDDAAMVSIAASVLRGEWLGEWGTQQVPHITLAKGPGYPLFLAAIHGTGLPPHLAAYLIYLAGATLVATTLHKLMRRGWTLALYAALVLNPVVFTPLFSRVYRDHLVAALALLALGLALHAASRLPSLRRGGATSWISFVVAVTFLGVTVGYLSITRGDTLWVLLVACGVILVGAVAERRRLAAVGWVAGGATLVILVGATQVVPLVIALQNERVYGVRLADDYGDGAFADAMTAWSSVVVPGDVLDLPVSGAQVDAVMAVSPTARSVADELGDLTFWVDRACTHRTGTLLAEGCDGFGAYLGWALRDAAYRQGARDPVAFQAFFDAIADEIRHACDTGSLTCGQTGISPDVPSFDRIPLLQITANLGGHINGALRLDTGQMPPQPTEPVDPDGVWTSTVNGADTAAALARSGVQARGYFQEGPVNALTDAYRVALTPLFVLAVVGAFRLGTWRSRLGWYAYGILAGWLANLSIVAIFYAGGNRTLGDHLVVYTMAGQAYLIAGLVLAAAVAVRSWRPQPAAEAVSQTSD